MYHGCHLNRKWILIRNGSGLTWYREEAGTCLEPCVVYSGRVLSHLCHGAPQAPHTAIETAVCPLLRLMHVLYTAYYMLGVFPLMEIILCKYKVNGVNKRVQHFTLGGGGGV